MLLQVLVLSVYIVLGDHTSQGLQLTNGEVSLQLNNSQNCININLKLGDKIIFSGQIGEEANDITLPEISKDPSNCFIESEKVTLNITSIKSDGFLLSWITKDKDSVLQDCWDLDIGATSWYGGSQHISQAGWPIENKHIEKKPYIISKTDYGAVSERYWLNSKGGYVFVDDRVPLFWDQNNLKNGSLCFVASAIQPYVGRSRVILEYALIAKEDPKEAHLNAVNNYLGKPKGHPDEWIIKNPIWTTWAKYHKEITDETVVAFAKSIADQGFTGQIEIDDYWETCYGSLIFKDKEFANINKTVQTLKDMGFTVTLWTHPFVNHDCEATMKYGEEHDYFVKSIDGNDVCDWWDGDKAHHLDYTKPEATAWFVDRLKLLQEKHGITSFKFDAGENDWAPANLSVSGDIELAPNSLTSAYVRTCASFGELIEVRSGWRSQDLPIFVRVLDRDSRWGLDNGLHSLITTLLTFNINGYTMVLPDIIGGNAYGDPPSAELLARWTEATTFMPAMQFSTLPWDITSDKFDGLAIIKKYVTLHERYSSWILEAMNNSITYGIPVNPPIWWLDPTNKDALTCDDEYLLGEDILVAPVIKEGATSRNVILPKGFWKDGNSGRLFEGPTTLFDYAAPIDVLPFFIRH